MPQKMKRALILRVERGEAGKTLPFDKLYFFRKSDEHTAARVFPYSLVLTLTTGFADRIKRVVSGADEVRGYPLHRRDEKVLGEQLKTEEVFNEVFKDRAKFVAVIPTLYMHTQTIDETGKTVSGSAPKYLCATPARHTSRSGRRGARSFDRNATTAHHRDLMDKLQSVQSYILVDGQKYRPICVACPNHMEVLQGRCYFGSDACYTHLSFTTPTIFSAGLAAYAALQKGEVLDPEVTDG